MSGYSDSDVIVAPATGVANRAPLAVVRVSGSGCWGLLARSFHPKKPGGYRSWRARYGVWHDGRGFVDDVAVIPYGAPRSYTGQEMFEVICHGNPMLVDAVVESLLTLGARRARPGEFTMRAVLNGKMDVLAAEAVHGVVEAHTRYQADLLRRQAKGPLVPFVRERVEEILQIQAHIEATIDYGEEDVDALERETLLEKMEGLIRLFEGLEKTAGFLKGMRRGFRVLLTGPPNAGKSTLFNALVRQERAIVTELPGTTRDVISEQIDMAGLPVVLLDSAGVRESEDLIETMGVARTVALLEEVDLVVYLTETGKDGAPYSQIAALPPSKVLKINTKADLIEIAKTEDLAVSAKTGTGMERLEKEIVLKLTAGFAEQQVYLINQRQQETIAAVIAQLGSAYEDYRQGFGEEVLSSYLNAARRLLGELTGETTVEDILDRMFSNFCLGK